MKSYFDRSPLGELAEKWSNGTFFCDSCELKYQRQEWSLYTDQEKTTYLAGMDLLGAWSEKI
eukprot:12606281-Prorocentrum_lima.AAC.1